MFGFLTSNGVLGHMYYLWEESVISICWALPSDIFITENKLTMPPMWSSGWPLSLRGTRSVFPLCLCH